MHIEKENTTGKLDVQTEKENTVTKTDMQSEEINTGDKPNDQLERETTTERVVNSIEIIVTPQLLRQYEQFEQKIGGQNNTQVDNLKDQDMEIIPEHPSEEIVLKVEEIPSLNIFYSTKHRVVVRKQRKIRRIDQ